MPVDLRVSDRRETSPDAGLLEVAVEPPASPKKVSLKRVLLATDFSPASQVAFHTALRLCVALDAHLSILHVFEYSSIVPHEAGGESLEMDSFYERAQNSLDDLTQIARRAGVCCEGWIDRGIPSSMILKTMISADISLSVIGTRSLHGFERLVFGSTAEAILRKASCPVLTVGPLVRDALEPASLEAPVVFATDFETHTTHAIKYAALFSEVFGAPLHCLHVLPRRLEGGTQSHILPLILGEALQRIAQAKGSSVDPAVCAIAYGSEVSNTVVEYARLHKARLIVLGVRRASIAASLIPAHIAYRVITEAPCPVLTLAFA